MKRRFGVVLCWALGLIGGVPGLTSSALARQVIWKHEYPDVLPTMDAPDTTVGVAASRTHAIVGGKRFYSPGCSVFQLVQYYYPSGPNQTGTIASELYWPAGDPTGQREVIAMTATETLNSDIRIILTGTVYNIAGYLRPATICVATNGINPSTGTHDALKLEWSRIEDTDAEFPGDQTPVAIHNDGMYVALVIQSGGDIITRVYSLADGQNVMTTQSWKQTISTVNATAVGVALVPTTHGPGVVVGATAPDPDAPGTQAITIYGYQVLKQDAIPSGTLLGSPVRLAKVNATTTDIAKAMAATPAGAPSGVVAITGHRTNGAVQDWITAALGVQARAAGQTDELYKMWQEGFSNGGNIDIPTAITVYDVSAGFTFGNLRIGVTGTTKETTQGATTGIVAAGYFVSNPPPPFTIQREWFEVWNNEEPNYESNDFSTSIVVATMPSIEGDVDTRMYVAGGSEKSVAGVPNIDSATIAFDARSYTVAPSFRRLWHQVYHGGVDGDDFGRGVAAREMRPTGATQDAPALFVTGTTNGPTWGVDWLTSRLIP